MFNSALRVVICRWLSELCRSGVRSWTVAHVMRRNHCHVVTPLNFSLSATHNTHTQTKYRCLSTSMRSSGSTGSCVASSKSTLSQRRGSSWSGKQRQRHSSSNNTCCRGTSPAASPASRQHRQQQWRQQRAQRQAVRVLLVKQREAAAAVWQRLRGICSHCRSSSHSSSSGLQAAASH